MSFSSRSFGYVEPRMRLKLHRISGLLLVGLGFLLSSNAVRAQQIPAPITPEWSDAGPVFQGTSDFYHDLSFVDGGAAIVVTGLAISDFDVENGSVTSISPTGDRSGYIISFAPSGTDSIRYRLAASTVTSVDGAKTNVASTWEHGYLVAEDHIVDNVDAEVIGDWTSSTYNANYYGTDYLYTHATESTMDQLREVKWRPTIEVAGRYSVYVRLPDGESNNPRTTKAEYLVRSSGGSEHDVVFNVDQTISPGGTWRLLGEFPFDVGTDGRVRLKVSYVQLGDYVIADAVRFVRYARGSKARDIEVIVDDTEATLSGTWDSSTTRQNYYGKHYRVATAGTGANSATWAPNLPYSGDYYVHYRLPNGDTDLIDDAQFTIHHKFGTDTNSVNQQETDGGVWRSIGTGTRQFEAGRSGKVVLTNSTNLSDPSTYDVVADVVRFSGTENTSSRNASLGATAKASSEQAEHPAGNAIDGNEENSSRWLSDGTAGPHWLMVRFQAPEELECAYLRHGFDGTGVSTGISSFKLQLWRENRWIDIPGAFVDSVGDSTKNKVDFDPPITTTGVRLYSADNELIKVKEFQLWTPGGGCPVVVDSIPEIYLNQSGFNLNESKRFTAPTSAANASFKITKKGSTASLHTGTLSAKKVGDFSGFNPSDDVGTQYVVRIGNDLKSFPFGIGHYWNERISYENAVQFMLDSRCYVGTDNSCFSAYGWRDGHQFSFEMHGLAALYLSNPSVHTRLPFRSSLYKTQSADGIDHGTAGFGAPTSDAPDVVKMMHWAANRYLREKANHPLLKGQLAVFLHSYPDISDYVSKSDYEKIRDYVIETWTGTAYDRINYYGSTTYITGTWDGNMLGTYSAYGNEKGSFPPGHSILPNLLMYEVALRDGLSNPSQYFDAAKNNANWVVDSLPWNGSTTKGQRMSEHITMEGLAFFQRFYPYDADNVDTSAPSGLLNKIIAWADRIVSLSDNQWDFRKYSDSKWIGHNYNEPGNIAGLPAAIYAALQVLPDQSQSDRDRNARLREIAVAHFDNIFGRNPDGRHHSFEGDNEFEGVEIGWYKTHAGAGKLIGVVGMLEGSSKEENYPYSPGDHGHTEGWVAFNSAWNASLAYAAHDKTHIRILDPDNTSVELTSLTVGMNDPPALSIELGAPLNLDYEAVETGEVLVKSGGGDEVVVTVTEQSANAAVFEGVVNLERSETMDLTDQKLQVWGDDSIELSYGFGQFQKAASYPVLVEQTAVSERTLAAAGDLQETGLQEDSVTLTLTGGEFEDTVTNDQVTLAGLTGLAVESVTRTSDTQLTVALDYTGTGFQAHTTVTVTVAAAALKDWSSNVAAQIQVLADPSLAATGTLHEDGLNDDTATLTLANREFVASLPANAVSVAGLPGLTVESVTRTSNTQLTVALDHDGTDFDADTTVTFTVKATAVDQWAKELTATRTATAAPTGPTALSIMRLSPTAEKTNADSVNWRLTFSEPVTNVDSTDFVVTGTTALATAVTSDPGAAMYDLRVEGGDLSELDAEISLHFAATQDIVAPDQPEDQSDRRLDPTLPVGDAYQTYRIDNTPPTVVGVTATTADGTYNTGETIDLTLTFTEPVLVFGMPILLLDTGSDETGPGEAEYDGGNPSPTLRFRYIVRAGDETDNLDYPDTNSLVLADGRIQDEAGNDAIPTLPAPGSPGSLGANTNIGIGATQPDTRQQYSGPPIWFVTVADAVATEGEPLRFRVTTNRPRNTRTMDFWAYTSPGTAAEDADYTGLNRHRVRIDYGETETFFEVATIVDETVEDAETVWVTLFFATRHSDGTRMAMARSTAAGTIVDADAPTHRIPLFPAADADGRQGFTRIVNVGDSAAQVEIQAIDEFGVGNEPLTLAIEPHGVGNFNANDLQWGNPAKGLSGGIGPVWGNLRLDLHAGEHDIEANGYLRTHDGFVTSLHDLAPMAKPPAVVREGEPLPSGAIYLVPTFNPGSNLDQVSLLRLTNAGEEPAAVSILGTDDSGASPEEPVRLTLPGGHSRILTAAEIESGTGLDGALGDGEGKWRLSVASDRPLRVQSLLESPTGHLTDLSTLAEKVADASAEPVGATDQGKGETAMAVWRVPIFPSMADANGRQGFVRLINRGDEDAMVTIEAKDDSTWDYEPLTLQIGAKQAMHFNSQDLEQGNAAKGLIEGFGPGQGDWRLDLQVGEQDIEVYSYLRTQDGFLASVHDLSPRIESPADAVDSSASIDPTVEQADDEGNPPADAAVYYVPTFNPGDNPNQVSWLRLVNDHQESVVVSIAGMDDGGDPSPGAARLALSGGTAVTLSAQDLEWGGEGLEGALGDGVGKWRLTVTADRPLRVQSLLASPTGHLTNLSTAPSLSRKLNQAAN